MKKNTISERSFKPVRKDLLDQIWKESWTYIKTVVDVVHEPVLILDKNFIVMAVNEPFIKTFQVGRKDTEGKLIYELGNGQWDIPALRRLLENILPKNTFFKGFEVTHNFPIIGEKIMILNARQIYCEDKELQEKCPPIILLAMEDITEMMAVAKQLANHTNQFEQAMLRRAEDLEIHIKMLERKIEDKK